jgi:hypothetical protein
MRRKLKYFAILSGITLAAALTTHGQWTNQSFTLRPGWNAVYLELQPEPQQCDAAFAGLPVESVWAWNRRFSTVQFVTNVNDLAVGQPDWLTYVPSNSPSRAVMNLFILEGGRPYLIKLRPDAPAVTPWRIDGKPIIRRPDWLKDSLNFMGFPLAATGQPTFERFFAASPAQFGKPVYRLGTDGFWQRVLNLSSATLARGEAFWVQSDGISTYPGPLSAAFEQGRGLDYGRILVEQTLRIQNNSTNTRTVTLRKQASASAPAGAQPSLAGDVPVCYFVMNVASNQFGWAPLPSQLSSNVPPGGEWAIRLEVRRTAMTPPAGGAGGLYQSLLEITDGAGSRLLVPITAKGLVNLAAGAGFGGFAPASQSPANFRAGLWVGNAVIREVSQPAFSSGPTATFPTASEFQFRLIVHVDNKGSARLLQSVLQMWKEGSLAPDPNGSSNYVVATPGSDVLVTDPNRIEDFKGVTLRHDKAVARRISTTAFGFRNFVKMTNESGTVQFGTSKINFHVFMGHDDPLNPFKHKYHPDHNNLDENYSTNKLGAGIESFAIQRDIELEFTAKDPENLPVAGWNDTQIGGNYSETIQGVHKSPLYVKGYFRFHQASRNGLLNDENPTD